MSEAIGAASARTEAAGWDWHWRRLRLPQLPRWFNPNAVSTRRLLACGLPAEARNVFEVGCAPGAWLAHLSRRHRVEVAGCDLSPLGVAATRENLRLLGVSGRILEADVFELGERIAERFDGVYSVGVIEHFDDLAAILRAHASLCVPGGRVVVSAPNLLGLSGAIFRAASPTLMDSHRCVTARGLRRAAREAGLEIVRCRYAGPLAAFVLGDRLESRLARLLAYALSVALAALTYPARGRLLSGSVQLIAQRPHTWVRPR